MAKNARSEIVLTPKFRLCFPRLFTPKRSQSGRDVYSMTMLFPKSTDITVLYNCVKSAAMQQWPNNWENILRVANPIKDGDSVTFVKGQHAGKLKRDVYPEFAGHWIVEATTGNKPGVVDQNVQPVFEESVLYAGCWCHAKVSAYTYQGEGAGVSFGLAVLQKVGEGERLGGGVMDAEAEFAPIPAQPGQAPAGYAPPAQGYTPPQQASHTQVFG